jgi:hypothetical protein
MITLTNGISITPVIHGREFLGLGRITANGVPLRSSRRPMFVEIRNPAGIQLGDFKLVRKQVRPSRVVLEFAMNAEQTGLMEFMLHAVRNRFNTTDWTKPAQPARDTRLSMEICPVSRHIGGHRFIGFSYQYSYRSHSIPIYKILDRATWEPGGRAVGNEFWMRNCFTPSIVPIRSRRQFHSTEWFLPSCDNPNILQFAPLQTELQGFTFTGSAAGILVTWATRVAHVRSLFEKPRGDDELVHWHEHCGDLANEFTTAPVEVLWLPGRAVQHLRSGERTRALDIAPATWHASRTRDDLRPDRRMERARPCALPATRTPEAARRRLPDHLSGESF